VLDVDNAVALLAGRLDYTGCVFGGLVDADKFILPAGEIVVLEIDDDNILHQTATFRPRGLWGRLYWFSMLPFHYFIFGGMIRNIARYEPKTTAISNS